MTESEHKELPNQAKVDWLLSDERNFPHFSVRPHCRYLICSTARCGSNLVGDMLHQTGLAGDPLEYLNTRYIKGVLRKQSLSIEPEGLDLAAYLAGLEQVRTSPNGYFGMKAHFEHVENLVRQRPADAQRLLRRFDRFVLLRRRGKLEQAVSLYRARATQIWSSLDLEFMEKDNPRRHMQVPFSGAKIARALADICRQEKAWEDLLTALSLPFQVFWYEDFVQDYAAASADLLRVLGLPVDSAQPTAPRLRKQGQADDVLIDRFRAFLG